MRTLRILIAALAAAGIAAAAPAAAQTTMTLSSWLPPGHAVSKALIDWAKDVVDQARGVNPKLERMFDRLYRQRPVG